MHRIWVKHDVTNDRIARPLDRSKGAFDCSQASDLNLQSVQETIVPVFCDRCCCPAQGRFCIPRSYWKTHMINRRNFLQGSGAFAGLSAMGLSGCTRHVTAPMVTGAPALPFYDAVGPIIPIRADMDRIFRITVCTRPFGRRVHGRMWSGSGISLSCITTATVGAAGRFPGGRRMWWSGRCSRREAGSARWR